MDRRIAALAGWFALSIGLVAQAPRDTGGRTPNQAQGTGVIAGMVMSDSGTPLARVRVTLSSSAFRSTITDGRGVFAFANLPADEYTLAASRLGYLDVEYGQRQPGSGHPGTPIRLASDQRVDRVALQMPRGAVITGMVIDESGEPAMAVPVRAYRRTIRDGEPSLAPASFAQTDDRGIYRIPFLPPGDYIVAASPRMEMGVLQVVDTAAAVVSDSWTAVAGDAVGAPAYAPVFYPGTTQGAEAAIVVVGISEERANVNIPLQRVLTGRISGTVVSPGGGPQSGVQVTLVESQRRMTSVGTRSSRTGSRGQFTQKSSSRSGRRGASRSSSSSSTRAGRPSRASRSI